METTEYIQKIIDSSVSDERKLQSIRLVLAGLQDPAEILSAICDLEDCSKRLQIADHDVQVLWDEFLEEQKKDRDSRQLAEQSEALGRQVSSEDIVLHSPPLEEFRSTPMGRH
jgi:hypothetical protein